MTLFIFEGLPGSGKTTLTKDLSCNLKANRIGEIIDKNLKEILPSEVGNVKQSFFFNSDKRKYFLASKYSKKRITLMDRGYLSTIVYNLCLNKNIEKIYKIEKILNKIYSMDCVYIYIKISPETSLSRSNKIPNDSNDMWSFLKNLCKTGKFYDDRLMTNRNLFIVDGSLSYKKVYGQIKSFIINYERNKKVHPYKYQ